MPPVSGTSQRKIKDNWVFNYSSKIKQHSEAPDCYNVWSAISVVSSVLKKRVWVNRGTFKIYPNQYIVLVGPPGVGKGTAIHPAHDFIREHKPPLANYISDRVTAPRIIELLSKGFPTTIIQNGLPILGSDATAVLMCSELQTFLGSSDWMLPFLCDVWDNKPFNYDTKNKGTHTVKDLCVSLIGACVPEFIRRIDKNTGEAVNGGFTARTLFIFAAEKSKSLAWPAAFAGDKDLEHDLERISHLSGDFSFDPLARILWERNYRAIQVTDDDSLVVRNFKARQSIHIMKVCMALSAAQDDSMVIAGAIMDMAIQLVQQVLESLDITFRGVGESPLAEATAKIQGYIERKGIATRAEILKDCYRSVTGEDLDRVLFTLETIGFCDRTTVGGRPMFKHSTPKGMKGVVNGTASTNSVAAPTVTNP